MRNRLNVIKATFQVYNSKAKTMWLILNRKAQPSNRNMGNLPPRACWQEPPPGRYFQATCIDSCSPGCFVIWEHGGHQHPPLLPNLSAINFLFFLFKNTVTFWVQYRYKHFFCSQICGFFFSRCLSHLAPILSVTARGKIFTAYLYHVLSQSLTSMWLK